VFAGVHGVYYRNLPNSVTIVRIIDGRRDLEAIGDWDIPPNRA
jgi:plasmid stabilization system protein ParE